MSASISHLPTAVGAPMARPFDLDDEILQGRAELLNQLRRSLDAVGVATRQLAALRGPDIYDVEVAEGWTGRDIADHLEDSRRSLAAAAALAHMAFDHEQI